MDDIYPTAHRGKWAGSTLLKSNVHKPVIPTEQVDLLADSTSVKGAFLKL